MFQSFFKGLFALAFFSFSYLSESSANTTIFTSDNNISKIGRMADGTPIVAVDVIMGRNTVIVTWDYFSQPGNYTVEVNDLTSFTLVTSFQTSGNSATITGLTAGHTYSFSVTDGVDYIIIEDVVH